MSDQITSQIEQGFSAPEKPSAPKPLGPQRASLGTQNVSAGENSAQDSNNPNNTLRNIANGENIISGTPAANLSVVEKDSRELLHQLGQALYSKEAEAIVEEVGYDEQKVKAKLEQMAKERPDDYKTFLWSLRREVRQGEAEVHDAFTSFDASHPEDESFEARKQTLQERIFRVGAESNPERAKKELQETFPSGNYLVHGTSVEGALATIGDGAIKSMAERRNGGDQARGKGGYYGISFNYDGIGAIPGTPRHMVAFMTSPEMVLDPKTKLIVPYLAAENELQYVPSTFDRQTVAQVESQVAFMGITLETLMGDSGVISNYINLKDSIESGKGDSPIESDLAKLKTGDIKIEAIQSQYKYEDGKFTVHPTVNQGEISAGTIYADFLLKHTEAGRALGKTLLDVTPHELLTLETAAKLDTKALVNRLQDLGTEMDTYGGLSIPIEQLVMLVPDNDLDRWVDSLARTGHLPKALLAYSHLDGPRVPNWKLPEGHKEKAEKVVKTVLAEAGVPEPSLPFEAVLGKAVLPEDITGKTIKYLKWEAVEGANEIVKDADGTIATRPMEKEVNQTSSAEIAAELSLRDKMLSDIEKVVTEADPQVREQQVEAFIQRRVAELTEASEPKSLSLAFGSIQEGFIHPDSRVVRSFFVDPVRINDPDIYKTLLESIRQYKETPGWQEKSMREIAQFALTNALGNYFGNWYGSQDTEAKNREFYFDHSAMDSDDISIAEMKGKSIGVCAEKASVAQNLLSFMGYDSQMVMSSNNRLNASETDDRDGHAYIIINTDKGHFIYDPTNPAIAEKPDGSTHAVFPANYPIIEEQYQNLMKGGQVEVTHTDLTFDGTTYVRHEGVKRMYGGPKSQ